MTGIRRLFTWNAGRRVNEDITQMHTNAVALGGVAASTQSTVWAELHQRKRPNSAHTTTGSASAPPEIHRLRFGTQASSAVYFITKNQVIETGAGVINLFDSIQLYEKRRPVAVQTIGEYICGDFTVRFYRLDSRLLVDIEYSACNDALMCVPLLSEFMSRLKTGGDEPARMVTPAHMIMPGDSSRESKDLSDADWFHAFGLPSGDFEIRHLALMYRLALFGQSQ